MPINTELSLAAVNKAKKDIYELFRLSREDLKWAESCLRNGAESDRNGMLVHAATEFMNNLNAKVRLAANLVLSLNQTMAQSVHEQKDV